MTKGRSSEFFIDNMNNFWLKCYKKVVQKFSVKVCSDEFFLKHALDTRSFISVSIKQGPICTGLEAQCVTFFH